MEEFLTLLLSYYTCDAAAQSQTPLGGQRLACVETYEAVKAYFAPLSDVAPGTQEYGEWRIDTYRAFQTWQSDNADLVADLRAQAEAAAMAPEAE